MVNKPINMHKNLKECSGKLYKIGLCIINKESVLLTDSWWWSDY